MTPSGVVAAVASKPPICRTTRSRLCCGPQRRGPCPVHAGRAQRRGRTFSVNLDDNVFHCFDAACGIQGDVIDLWAALKKLPLREAALDLARTFALEAAPPP